MENNRKFPSSIIDVIKLFLVYLAISFLLGVLIAIIQKIIEEFFLPHGSEFDLLKGGFSNLLIAVITFGFFLLYINKTHKIVWPDIFRFSTFPKYILLPLVPLIIGEAIIISEIDNIFRFIIPIPEFFTQVLFEMQNDGLYSAVLIIVIAPLTEEILFRGVILEGFLNRYSPTKAILYSSVFFSLFHFNPLQFVSAFAGGVLLGYIYTKTRSLIPCILMHAFFNSICFSASQLPVEIPGFSSDPLGVHEFQPLWLDFLGIALFCIGIWLLMKYFSQKTALVNQARNTPT